MKTTKLFKNGESQAVRLPKEFRFPGKEMFIKRVGSAVVLSPLRHLLSLQFQYKDWAFCICSTY